ncbi:MAG: TonB-dependent receptor [Flavobacteriaceae bacterium]|nr:TonB-dependent receptor [Flavobacteriaceae bacterium]
MKKYLSLLLLCLCFNALAQQEQDSIATKQLKEVIVSSTRIDLPLSENARSIQVITRENIRQAGVTTIADLLQQVAGVDIRRRGIAGMQADLYIRGGSFDQTLLLIDGIKLDDAQTGHHTLNLALPLEVIERIEIIKGPAARIFGQNAFTGAINIVTKSSLDTTGVVNLQAGSYNQVNVESTVGTSKENFSLLAHYSHKKADGYRYNTDFENQNVFLKGQFNKQNSPIDFIASFSERKFGANGFYALPSYADQYEETQGSLIAFSSRINKGNWLLKPRLYWRRGQDEYIFVRSNPAIYRNLHITHKVGFAFDASNTNKLGQTGLGIDFANVSIASNNLGDRSRFMTTVFAEHRFLLSNDQLDITPGVAVTNYTDFGTQLFPGVDISYALSEALRIYGNVGYTYRIPTFTDLYYSDSTTLGNEDLKPEEALTEELGLRLIINNFQFSAAAFLRQAENLIDYIRPTEEGRFEATNVREVNTHGVELEAKTQFKIGNQPQQLQAGYVYLKDDVKSIAVNTSRYTINSLRHHFTFNYRTNVTKDLSGSIAFKHAQRPMQDSYQVLDLFVQWQINNLRLSFSANNVLNEVYSESNLVPMPLGNGLVGVQVVF